ncbi:MAG: hypothetical protein H6567_08240 [Lewinellaceae bacterium]|nr:hypothetical protein [Lewinellaceae bacterium]
MKTPDTLIVHPSNEEQLSVIKAFLEALKINFEFSKDTYNPEFVAEVLKGKQDIDEGKFTDVKLENIKDFMDSL